MKPPCPPTPKARLAHYVECFNACRVPENRLEFLEEIENLVGKSHVSPIAASIPVNASGYPVMNRTPWVSKYMQRYQIMNVNTVRGIMDFQNTTDSAQFFSRPGVSHNDLQKTVDWLNEREG